MTTEQLLWVVELRWIVLLLVYSDLESEAELPWQYSRPYHRDDDGRQRLLNLILQKLADWTPAIFRGHSQEYVSQCHERGEIPRCPGTFP